MNGKILCLGGKIFLLIMGLLVVMHGGVSVTIAAAVCDSTPATIFDAEWEDKEVLFPFGGDIVHGDGSFSQTVTSSSTAASKVTTICNPGPEYEIEIKSVWDASGTILFGTGPVTLTVYIDGEQIDSTERSAVSGPFTDMIVHAMLPAAKVSQLEIRVGFLALGNPSASYFGNITVRPLTVPTDLPMVLFDVPKKEGVYGLQADEKSKATAFLSDESILTPPITWSLVGATLGCSLNNQTITAGKDGGTVTVRATDSIGISVDGLLDLQECGPCDSGDCTGIGGITAELGSVDVRIGLGWSSYGQTAGYLQIKEELPSTVLAQPESLQYRFARLDVEVLPDNGVLKQIKSPDGLANITVVNTFKYSINLFSLTNVLTKTNGFYELINSPFSIVTIENPNDDTNKLKVTYSRDGSDTVYDYNWITNGWEFISGGGLRKEIKTTVWSDTNTVRTVTTTIQQGSNPPVFQKSERFQIFSHGEKLVKEIIGTGNNTSTNTFTYTANGDPQQVERGDGSWTYYLYNTNGLATNVFSGFLNQAVTTNKSLCRLIEYDYSSNSIPAATDNLNFSPGTPRRTIESLLGNEIRRSYFVALPWEIRQITCVNPSAAWNDASNLVTITKQFTNGFHVGETASVSHPDGTVDLYRYGAVGTWTTNTVLTGHPDGTGTNIDSGTTTVSIIDQNGKLLSQTRVDVPSNIPLSEEVYYYDGFKRLVRTAFLDGTSITNTYNCCSLISTVERDGTVVSFTHDALKRQLTTTRAGIMVSNVYDAIGNVLATVRYGTAGSSMTLSQSAYNDSGERIISTDALNNTTRHTNFVDGSGQRIRMTTYPDLTTRVETYARDGLLLTIAGTAVRGVRYDYGAQSEGGFQRPFSKEIKLDSNGSDTSEWTKTYTDGAGRTYKMVYADATTGSETDNPFSESYFNAKGQLWKNRDPDGVVTIYTNNVRGELAYTCIDSNRNDVIDFSGQDRIIQVTNDVVSAHGTNVIRTRTYVWETDGNSTSTLLSTVERSVEGLKTWQTNAGVASATERSLPSSGNYTMVQYAPDNSYNVNLYSLGRLSSVTRYDSNSVQIGKTSYGYDAHGRQSTATDARTGTTTYGFNNADQVVTVTTPSPGTPGGTAQTTTIYYDAMGRATNIVHPDGASVVNRYSLRGELVLTSGSRTYPVGYAYDAQGRMKYMTNWSGFSAGSGARLTTWHYDASRGWMTNKVYDDGKGTKYSYTAAGRLNSRFWARGTNTTYTYNNFGDLSSVSYNDVATPSVTYTYDRRGLQRTVARGSDSWRLFYNTAGQLVSEAGTAGTLTGLRVTNAFDGLLRRTNVVVANGATSLATNGSGYDAAGRLSTVGDGTFSATYTYLANSPLVSQFILKSNTTVRLTTIKSYDFLNRLTTISSQPAGSGQQPLNYTYSYNEANQRTRVNLADGSFWIYTYDSLGQVVSGKRYWSDWTPVAGQQFEYGFDDIGNRASTKAGGDQTGAGLRSASYTVNTVNQITQRGVPAYVDVIGAATATATNVNVNNQAAYRRGEYYWKELSINNASTAQWQSVTNRAVQNGTTNSATGNVFVPKTPEVLTYDADGNLTNDGRWAYVWDGENRLVRMVAPSMVPTGARKALAFTYDWQGRRISKTVSNWTGSAWSKVLDEKYVYDGWNLLSSLNASNNAVVQSFLWGNDLSGSLQGAGLPRQSEATAGGVGGLLAVSARGSSVSFTAYDGNGNIIGLVNAADGTNVVNYEYGPFGEVIRCSGTAAKTNPFRFSTKYQDEETDLLYFGYRYLRNGSWLSRDPIGEKGGINLYGFVYNNPINFVDPLGLEQFKVVCDKAADLDRRIQGLRSNTGDKFKRVFLGLQSCILNKLCKGACCNADQSAAWLNGTIDTFMTQFTDALDGKFYPQNRDWKPLLDQIDKLRPLTPRPEDMKYFSMGVPAGGSAISLYVGSAFTDYATGVEIARQMALTHINQDLALALRRNTPGLDTDWKCVGGVVADCQKDFFNKLELLLGSWLPKDKFDIPFIRDQMRERIKDELSQPQIGR